MSTVIQHYTHTDSLGYGGEAFERGTPVIRKADDADKWVICPSGTKPIGYSFHDVRDFGERMMLNIYNQENNTGLPRPAGGIDARRNSHKPFLAAIGDPITVAVGSGIIMENVANYVGSPGNNDYLKVGGSGNFTAGTATDGCVRVMRGGSKAAGDTIRVISL
jgi:hypothetical protein